MANRLKKIAIFYRDLPSALERIVAADAELRLIKDGVFTHNGVRCPRATLSLEWTGSKADREKLEKLTRLLEELEGNNQIAAFSIRS